MVDEHPPEMSPPSPKPSPRLSRELSSADYLIELAERLDSHIKTNVIGVRAKREVGYAAMIIRQLGKERKENRDAT